MEQVESEQAQQEVRKSPYLQPGPNQMEKVQEMPAQVEQTVESHMVTENEEPDQPHILATEQNVADQ